MATDYCQSSSLLSLPANQIDRALEIARAEQEALEQGQDGLRVRVERNPEGLWIFHPDFFCPFQCARVAKRVMDELEVEDDFMFSWAHYCSAPRLDHFHGGAGRVAAGEEPELFWGQGEIQTGEEGRLGRLARDIVLSKLLADDVKIVALRGIAEAAHEVLGELTRYPVCRGDPEIRATIIESGEARPLAYLYARGASHLDREVLLSMMDTLMQAGKVDLAAQALKLASLLHSGSLTLRASHLAAILSGVSQEDRDAIMSLMPRLDVEQREASAAGAGLPHRNLSTMLRHIGLTIRAQCPVWRRKRREG